MNKKDILSKIGLARPEMFDLAISEIEPVLYSRLNERDDFAISFFSVYYDKYGIVSWHFNFRVMRGGYLAEDISGLSVGIAVSSGRPLVKVLYHGQDRHNWSKSYQLNGRGQYLPVISFRRNYKLEFILDK